MGRNFEVKPGPHAPQLAIQAHDMSREECQFLRGIVTNNYMPSDDYKLGKKAGAFLQGYQEPYDDNTRDGRVLVEFWTSERADIDTFVKHVNDRLGSLK